MNQIFDINRVMLFSKLKFNLNKKMFLISTGGFFGLLFIITFFMAYSISPGEELIITNFHKVAYGIMLFAGTVFLASRSYYDMNTPEKSITQILIPASTFEKFIVPAFATSFGWLIFSFLSYEVFSAFVNFLWSGLFGLSIEFFYIFDSIKNEGIPDLLKGFLLIHSIYFLGATAFKKYPLGKTLLAGFLINAAITIFTLILMITMFGSLRYFGSTFDDNSAKHFIKQIFSPKFAENLSYAVEMVFTIFLPLTFYVAAFFKLKEREA